MGYVQKVSNGTYNARWREPDGRLRSKAFDLERDARRHLKLRESEVIRGVYVDDRAGKVSFAEWAEHCMAIYEKKLSRTSYARDRSYFENHVLPKWGGVRLNRITKAEVERWVADLADHGHTKRARGGTLAPATIERIYQVFRKIMKAAYDDDRIPKLPCPDHPPIARKKRKPVRFLDEGEVAHFASCIDPLYESTIYVASYGGFRIGELFALRLNDVDWTRGTIRVDEGLTDVSGVLEFEQPKTDRSFRSVPIADLALRKLREHIEATSGWDDPSALLYTSSQGAVIRPTNWRRREFADAVKAAKLEPLTPHDLRHTAASLFISAGANPWMLAEVLGHSDTRMIDRVYGHLFERDREDLRKRMSEKAERAAGENVLSLSGRSDRRVS